MAHAIQGSPYPLRAQLADGNPALYPRARIYNSAGSLVATIDLTHIADGLYGATVTFVSVGYFSIVYVMYSDSLHTVVDTSYDREAEDVEVTTDLPASIWDALVDSHLGANTMGEAMAIMRGLLQHNYILDNTTYNTKGLLVGGRIRVFKNKADTDSETSPIATFTITGTAEAFPNDMLGQTLKVTRDP